MPLAHAKQIDRLRRLIAVDDGGPDARSSACGQPASLLGSQSTLAWAVGLNVGNVGYHPAERSTSG